MTELTGTATLTRFILRRDRVRILVWVVATALLVVLTAASVKGLYPTQADLDAAAAATHGNAAAIALNGPDQGLNTLGGQVAFQVGFLGLVVVALMSMFTVGRETRAEEEAGRLELIRAMAVGRHAPPAAALTVTVGMNVVVAALVTLGLLGLGLPTTGSVVFGVSFCALGLVFAGVATVAAEVTENTRVVYGATGAVLGAAFVLRAVGDVGDGTLSWFSPIGWAQKTRPFAGERWWPLLVAAAATAGLLAAAGALAARRDVGAGLVPPRPGPRGASPGLGRPLGLALRLQRGSLVGWSVGLFLTGVTYGWTANNVEHFVGDNQTIRDVFARAGASLTDSFLSTVLLVMALIAAGYAVQSALRLRSEETGLRAEPVLATPVSRRRWVASHLAVALAGSVIVLAAVGLGAGLTYGIASPRPGPSTPPARRRPRLHTRAVAARRARHRAVRARPPRRRRCLGRARRLPRHRAARRGPRPPGLGQRRLTVPAHPPAPRSPPGHHPAGDPGSHRRRLDHGRPDRLPPEGRGIAAEQRPDRPASETRA